MGWIKKVFGKKQQKPQSPSNTASASNVGISSSNSIYFSGTSGQYASYSQPNYYYGSVPFIIDHDTSIYYDSSNSCDSSDCSGNCDSSDCECGCDSSDCECECD